MAAEPGALTSAAQPFGVRRWPQVSALLGWWKSELLATLPPRWRERLSPSRGLGVMKGEGGWRLKEVVGGRLVEAQPHKAPGPGAALRVNLWLLLGADEALTREVALPMAAEESLHEAVGFELDRLTPLSTEQAWFDCRVVRRDPERQLIFVALAVSPKDRLEPQVDELRKLGGRALGICTADEFVAAAEPLNLLPRAARDRAVASGADRAARLLAGIAIALALAALAYPLWAKREAAMDLQPRVEKARASAAVSERLSREIEKLAMQHNFVLGKRHGQPPMSELLDALARQLPDNTWVQQLEVKPPGKTRDVQIAGETGSSTGLIEALERSGLLANATFKSPLTKGATPNSERYLVAAELKPRPLPPPVPEAELRAPSATPAAGDAPGAQQPGRAGREGGGS